MWWTDIPWPEFDQIPAAMMTSSNGNIFRVTGPLCGEFTGPGEFHTQRPVTRSFDVFFDLRLYKRLSKQPWGWWFETLSWSLWRHCNGNSTLKWLIYTEILRSPQYIRLHFRVPKHCVKLCNIPYLITLYCPLEELPRGTRNQREKLETLSIDYPYMWHVITVTS